MDSFSDQLRAEAEPIWREIFAHPFLKGIKDGTLPIETFQYYLGQDYLYLEGFARCVAIALAKAPTIGVIEEMAKRVMTPIERPLHHKLLAEAGLSEAEVAGAQPSPTNAGYVNHMLAVANREGLGPTAAAMLPMSRGPTTCCARSWASRSTRFTASGPAFTSRGCWKTASPPGAASSTGRRSTPVRRNWSQCDRHF